MERYPLFSKLKFILWEGFFLSMNKDCSIQKLQKRRRYEAGKWQSFNLNINGGYSLFFKLNFTLCRDFFLSMNIRVYN